MIHINCPGCGKAFRVKDGVNVQAFAGKKVKCPACAAFLDIPGRVEIPTPAAKIPSPQERGETQRLEEEERTRREEERRKAEAADAENLMPHSAAPTEVPAATPGAPSAMIRLLGFGVGRLLPPRAAAPWKNPWVILSATAAVALVTVVTYSLYHRWLMAQRLHLMDQCKFVVALDNDPDYQSATEGAITALMLDSEARGSGDARQAQTERKEASRLIQESLDARQAAARKAGVPNIFLDDAERALEKFDHEHIGIAHELGYKVGEWK